MFEISNPPPTGLDRLKAKTEHFKERVKANARRIGVVAVLGLAVVLASQAGESRGHEGVKQLQTQIDQLSGQDLQQQESTAYYNKLWTEGLVRNGIQARMLTHQDLPWMPGYAIVYNDGKPQERIFNPIVINSSGYAGINIGNIASEDAHSWQAIVGQVPHDTTAYTLEVNLKQDPNIRVDFFNDQGQPVSGDDVYKFTEFSAMHLDRYNELRGADGLQMAVVIAPTS
jgi:hypothetical protein